MNQLEMIHKRSENLIKYFWLTWIFGIVIELVLKAPIQFILTLAFGGIIIFGIIHILIRKKIMIQTIPYLIVLVSYGLCYLMIMQNLHITTMVLFFYGITMVSFYHDIKPVILSYIISTCLSIYLFITKPTIFHDFKLENYGTFLAVLLIVAGAMVGQAIIVKNAEKKLKKQNIEIEREKQNYQVLFDEVKKSIYKLTSFASKFNENMNSINHEANEMVDEAKEIKTGTEKQNSYIKDINQTILKVEETLTKTTNSIGNLQEINMQSNESIVSSDKEIKKMKKGLTEVEELIDTTNESFVDLNDSIKDIQTFLQTIDKISEQSKLLSINASIEAARFGESGRGFMVVAEEMKKLSETTANTTQKIAEISQSIKSKANKTEMELSNNQKQIQEHIRLMGKFEQTFEKIKQNYFISETEMNTLNFYIKELKQNSDEILTNTKDIESVVEHNEKNIENMNEKINIQTNKTKSTVKEYRDILEQTQHLEKIIKKP